MKTLTKVYLAICATAAAAMQIPEVQQGVIVGLTAALHSHPNLCAMVVGAVTVYLTTHNPKKTPGAVVAAPGAAPERNN